MKQKIKNITFVTCAILILVVGACKKDNTSAPGPGGSWSIKGRTFNTANCGNAGGGLTAVSAVSDSCTVLFSFNTGTALPTSSGTYTVKDGLSGASNQVAISLYIGSFVSYSSTNNGTVAVTVSGGKVNVVGNGVIMKNDNVAGDSTAFTFNITQLQ